MKDNASIEKPCMMATVEAILWTTKGSGIHAEIFATGPQLQKFTVIEFTVKFQHTF